MNAAVGIDVSKGKSVVAAMRPFGELAMPLREFLHTSAALSSLTESNALTNAFIAFAAGQLVAATTMLAALKAEFIRLAATLPEYEAASSYSVWAILPVRSS